MTRPLLSFVAIVRDEAHNLRSTLESVRAIVDTWTVLDTGSTDGTQDLVREVMAGVPGRLVEEPFVDFGFSRNRVLELDAEAGEEAAEFTIMLSGDEVLENGEMLRAFLDTQRDAEYGAYLLQLSADDTQVWLYPRILRTRARWRYVGVVHEAPHAPDGGSGVSMPFVRGARILHRISDHERRARRIREFDLPALLRAVADESRPLEDRAHALFYLGETHAALSAETPEAVGGEHISHAFSAIGYYLRYAQLSEQPGSSSYDLRKSVLAWFRIFNLAAKLSFFTDEELERKLSALAEADPDISEVQYMRAACAANIDAKRGLFFAVEAAETARRARVSYLTTDPRMEWMSLALAAACALTLGRVKRARELVDAALAAGAPAEEKKVAEILSALGAAERAEEVA